MKSLHLETTETAGYVGAQFDDERARSRAGDVDRYAVASITLDSDKPDDESSWGVFLTLSDVASLHAWTGALLADYYAEEKP